MPKGLNILYSCEQTGIEPVLVRAETIPDGRVNSVVQRFEVGRDTVHPNRQVSC
jgi:hypothetical protein